MDVELWLAQLSLKPAPINRIAFLPPELVLQIVEHAIEPHKLADGILANRSQILLNLSRLSLQFSGPCQSLLLRQVTLDHAESGRLFLESSKLELPSIEEMVLVGDAEDGITLEMAIEILRRCSNLKRLDLSWFELDARIFELPSLKNLTHLTLTTSFTPMATIEIPFSLSSLSISALRHFPPTLMDSIFLSCTSGSLCALTLDHTDRNPIYNSLSSFNLIASSLVSLTLPIASGAHYKGFLLLLASCIKLENLTLKLMKRFNEVGMVVSHLPLDSNVTTLRIYCSLIPIMEKELKQVSNLEQLSSLKRLELPWYNAGVDGARWKREYRERGIDLVLAA